VAVDRTFALPLPRTPSLPRWVRLPRRPLLVLGTVLLALLLAGGGLYLREQRYSGRVHLQRYLSPTATVLAAAPPTLAGWVARVYEGHEGLTVAMRGGLLLYFGDDRRPHAKWLSAARVLASPSSAGAVYIDVRVPERPAAGFPPGTQPPEVAAAGAPSTGSSTPTDPTSASLAESLEAAIGSGVAPSTATNTTENTSTSATTTAASAAVGAEAGAAADASTPTTATTTETQATAPISSGNAGESTGNTVTTSSGG
jgi:hypothetical protein